MGEVELIVTAVALKKVLGPTFEQIGKGLKHASKAGWEKLSNFAWQKIENPDDGKRANERVAYDILWNGGWTDDDVCAEYFGGVLASSRSEDGKDDSNIQFTNVIRSLSSSQLRLHCLIYTVLNKMLVASKSQVNVAQNTEIEQHEIWLSAVELLKTYQIKIDADFNALYRQGLVSQYKWEIISTQSPLLVPYGMAKPTTFGVMLYAAAHNRLSNWGQFQSVDFGSFDSIDFKNFESITTPRYFGATLNELKKAYK